MVERGVLVVWGVAEYRGRGVCYDTWSYQPKEHRVSDEKPIRLADAIDDLKTKLDDNVIVAAALAWLFKCRDGGLVTPADEALARIEDPYMFYGANVRCIGCLTKEDHGGGHFDDCAWVEACRKVAPMEDQ